jgi:hypothetical protein
MTTAYEHKTELVGDDYEGLPTRPVTYRGRRQQSSVDWDQITADYIARGGQVDASVWPKHGKVIVIGGSANSSRANLHSFTEANEYDEPAAPSRTRTSKTATTATPRKISVPAEQRPEIASRYTNGESTQALAKAYGVSEGSIRYAIKATGTRIRTKKEAFELYRERNVS